MATTPYQYGRFIGRVGALAVGLGIGAAIANGPAIAAADDGQSSGSRRRPQRRGPRTRDRRPARPRSRRLHRSRRTRVPRRHQLMTPTNRPPPRSKSPTTDVHATSSLDAKSTRRRDIGQHEDADDSPTPDATRQEARGHIHQRHRPKPSRPRRPPRHRRPPVQSLALASTSAASSRTRTSFAATPRRRRLRPRRWPSVHSELPNNSPPSSGPPKPSTRFRFS